MKLKSSVSNLKEVTDILSSITNEAKLEFDNEGLKVRAIDSARIAMVDLFVPKTGSTSGDNHPLIFKRSTFQHNL